MINYFIGKGIVLFKKCEINYGVIWHTYFIVLFSKINKGKYIKRYNML